MSEHNDLGEGTGFSMAGINRRLGRGVPWERIGDWEQVKGRNCTITLEARPRYCDRGNFIAKLFNQGPVKELYIDETDGWPRYYFDLERAKLEIEAWLVKRGQMPVREPGTPYPVGDE